MGGEGMGGVLANSLPAGGSSSPVYRDSESKLGDPGPDTYWPERSKSTQYMTSSPSRSISTTGPFPNFSDTTTSPTA